MSITASDIPDGFRQLGSKLYNGSLEEADNLDAWFAQGISALDPETRTTIAMFLDQLLAGKYSDQDLQHAWVLGGSDYGVRTQDYRGFLALLRNKLPD